MNRKLLPLLILVACASMLGVLGPASAATLTHKPTGFKATAPAGYKLSYANGYYTIRSRAGYVVMAQGESPMNYKRTGEQTAKASGGRVLQVKVTKKQYRAVLLVGKQRAVLQVRSLGGNRVSIALMGAGTPAKLKRSASPVGPTSRRSVVLTPALSAQIAVLERILESRRGGAAAQINTPLPMRLVETSDRGARALIPDLPGWQFAGGNGLFAVGFSFVAAGWFGTTPVVLAPGNPFAQPAQVVAPAADPAAMLPGTFQVYFPQVAGGQQVQVTNVQLIPGTQGSLGSGIPSGMYVVKFTSLGRAYTGIFNFGMTNFDPWFTKTYLSAIWVLDGAPGGISQALLRSWTSYSGEVGFRRMLSTGLDIVANGKDATLTPSQFNQDASTWIELVQSGAL